MTSLMFGSIMTQCMVGKYLITTGVTALAATAGIPALVPLALAATPTVAAIGTVYLVSKIYSPYVPEGSFHSCYTWSKERVLELDVPAINNDVRLKCIATDYIASVTSFHMSKAHNDVHQGSEHS